MSRIPVCLACLASTSPLQTEYFCAACRTPFASGSALTDRGFCTICESGFVNFDAAYSYGRYEGNLRELIHLFKYGKVESLAAPLSRLLGNALPLETQFDAVLAMPMHWRKKWDRGFNQAELLASPIARRYGLPLSTNLRRSRYTKSQAGLNEALRRQNLNDSFRVSNAAQLAGKRVLVVDDVFTTGSTLRAAAEALKASGVSYVACLTLARVDNSISGTGSHDLNVLRSALSAANHSSPTAGKASSRLDHPVQVSPGVGVSDE